MMKHKTKTKNLEDSTQVASCHANSDKMDQSQPRGVRRSTRKRSAPKNFVVTSKKAKGFYWGTEEKEKLLKVLQDLNNQQLGPAIYYSKNRYPIKLIRKKIGSKSIDDVEIYLRSLERRAAGMTLSQMRHQAPLQSWRQMADKLTVLTSDNCSRQLIRVCSILALEGKDEENESSVKENDVNETQNILTSSVTPETRTPAAVNSTRGNHTSDVSTSTEITSPNILVSASNIATSTTDTSQNIPSTSPIRDNSSTSTATREIGESVSATVIGDKSSTVTPTAAATDTSLITAATTYTRLITAATTESTQTSATATSVTAIDSCSATADNSSDTTSTMESTPTSATATSSTDSSSDTTSTVESTPTTANSSMATDGSSATANKGLAYPSTPNKIPELELKPDYAAIYKYFANLMQGEQNELGGLESLVVLDCLKTVETNLVARDNTKQKKFVQKRFLDILENLYLSIDGETARTSEGTTKDEDTDAGKAVTVADLMGINKQSQSRNHEVDQSKATFPENSQSASNSSVGQSTSSMLQGQSSAKNKRSHREMPTRLGSLNPFGIPAKLLEIRQDK